MTDINERLKADAERMRDVAGQSGTTVPGTRQRRVWVDPDEIKGWADNAEAGSKELDDKAEPTACAAGYEDLYATLWDGGIIQE